MPRPLIVYGYTLMASPQEVLKHYPDTKYVSQVRAVVATRTKKEAIAAFGVSTGEARNYISVTGNEHELEIALAKPGQVFARPLNEWNGDYFEIERRSHVPRKRARGVLTHYTPPPSFTREELEAIAERFAMANDSIGQEIAAKALLMLGD